MPSDNFNTQTGTAGEAAGETTTNLTPDEGAPAAVTDTVPAAVADDADAGADVDVDDDPIVKLRIKTTHVDCGGIILGRDETEVDPTVLCDTEDDNFYDNNLSELDYDQLSYEIWYFLGQCGDHGAAEDQRIYLTFEYVYDEEGREAEDLKGVDDKELQRIIGAGSGFINVVWEWE